MESRETSLHTNIPIFAGSTEPRAREGKSYIPWPRTLCHFPATSIHGRVAVTRVTVHIVDTVAISACIRLTVINVLGYLSPVIAFLTPLLGMIELIPIFEFGMSEPT